MQDQGDADPRTEVLRIRGDGALGLGGEGEQKTVNHLLVGVGDGADRGGQGEHQVVIIHREQVRLTRLEPAQRGARLALRAMPVAARVVGDLGLGAGFAAQHVAAERGTAALLNGRHDLELA